MADIEPLNDGQAGESGNSPSTLHALGPLQRPAIAAAIALVVLPILYRLGFITCLAILVLAVGLNTVPEIRQLIDAFLGNLPTGRSRLSLIQGLESQRASPVDGGSKSAYHHDEESFVDLQVGEVLQPSLSRFIELVQRDFILYWYKSVALDDHTVFPKYTRSLLNCIFNNLVSRVKSQDPKEVSIYLFHSLSNALITQLRNEDELVDQVQMDHDNAELIRKVRRTSEELMLTLAPRSATSSPMITSLLTEVVSLQISSTIQSLNSDFINTAIVNNLGEAITLAKEAQHEAGSEINVTRDDTGMAATVPPAVASAERELAETQQRSSNGNSKHSMSSFEGFVTDPDILEKTIRLDDPHNPIAAAGMPGMVPILNAEIASRRSSGEVSRPGGIASPTTSQPGSPRTTQRKRLEDQTLEEALDLGAARLRAFGKGIMSAGSKFLDVALPTDEHIGSTADSTATSGARLKSLPVSRSGVGGVTGAGPSRKGKEREIDPIEPVHSPQTPSSSIHVRSPTSSLRHSIAEAGSSHGSSSGTTYAGSNSRPVSLIDSSSRPTSMMGSSSRPTSIMTGRSTAMSRSSSAHSSLLSPVTAQMGSPHSGGAPVAPVVRIQRILDSLDSGTPEQREKLVKQIEISLFSKDLSLLFPEDPPDDQLRAVLMRHSASDETVDPSLIELSDAFHEYIEKEGEDGPIGELVLRMWTLADHFGYMVSITHPEVEQIRGDALQLLKKLVDQARGLEVSFSRHASYGENSENMEKSYWTAVEMAILRLEQNPNREIFDPLKDWLLRFIQVFYWDRFLRSHSALADSSGVPVPTLSPPRLTCVPSASTSKRTLSFTGSPQVNHTPVTDDSFDLGSSMHPDNDVPIRRPSSSHHGDLANDANLEHSSQPQSAAATSLPNDTTIDVTPIVPSFTVSITDYSPPSAYQNNHVKNRKDLEFLIALEADGSPGYILTRKYIEFEKMDHGIKKALPLSGTKGFPRAPLPSTNFQTSDNLCRHLESYLEALLREPRYATCEPVVRFFEKERTDSKGGVVNPLAFLGQGVNNIGKGVSEVGKNIGKSGESAGRSLATGFNQFTTTITTIPRLKRTSSGHADGTTSGSGTPSKSKRDSISLDSVSSPMQARSSTDSLGLPVLSPSKPNLTSPSTTSLATSITSVQEDPEEPEGLLLDLRSTNIPSDDLTTDLQSERALPPPLPPRPASPAGYDVPAADIQATNETTNHAENMQESEAKQDMLPEVPLGFSYTPRGKPKAHDWEESRPSSPKVGDNASLNADETSDTRSAIASGRMSFEELLDKDRNLQRKMAERETEREAQLYSEGLKPESPKMEKSNSEPFKKKDLPPTPAPAQSTLSVMEFSSVLSFAMAILEEAYELSDGAWNFKRGILRVLETVLRTSYAGVIRAGVTKLCQKASEQEFYAKQIDGLRESFWPPPHEVWWSSVPGYTAPRPKTQEEKEATRLEARRLLQLQAPEGLKVALGATATQVALGRLHDCLQGHGAEAIVSTMMLDYLRLLLL